MGHDIPGKFIGLILVFFLLVVAPYVNVTVANEMIDRRSIITDVTNFMDEVVDSRLITDTALKELNTNIASYGVNIDYEITHYRRSVNPDPIDKDNQFYVSYIPVSLNEPWEKGDRIEVHIFTVGHSAAETLSHKIANLFVSDFDRRICARIR